MEDENRKDSQGSQAVDINLPFAICRHVFVTTRRCHPGAEVGGG